MKFDVKDFYLSGDHDILTERVSSRFSGEIKQWVSDCLETLLASQFVSSNLVVDALLKVVLGSGMGMKTASLGEGGPVP